MVEPVRLARDPAALDSLPRVARRGMTGPGDFAAIAAYVFGERGDVLSLIPAPLRGPLGSLSPTARAALCQQLRAASLKSS